MADADPWTMLLRAPRARDAFLLRVVMGGPWSLLVADEAPLTVMGQLQGNAWFAVEGGEPTLLHPGDVVLVRAPVHYRVASDPSVQPSMTIGPDQSCTGADGRELADALAQGVRTWGNDPAGADRLIVGTYRSDTQASRLLLGALPPALVVPAAAPELIGLLNRELAADADAGVLDRLLDLVLIDAVRTARAQLTSGAGGPVGVALRAITRHRRNRGRSARSPLGRGSRAQRSRPGFGTRWVTPRRPTSPTGGWHWPPICCSTPTRPWTRSRPGSATARRSASVQPSAGGSG